MSAQAREMVFESPFGRRGQPQEPRFNPEPGAPSDSLCVRMMWQVFTMRSLGIRRHFASPRV
jgi:hypothetical protein